MLNCMTWFGTCMASGDGLGAVEPGSKSGSKLRQHLPYCNECIQASDIKRFKNYLSNGPAAENGKTERPQFVFSIVLDILGFGFVYKYYYCYY